MIHFKRIPCYFLLIIYLISLTIINPNNKNKSKVWSRKALKPDWDKLIADFADSPNQLVADVDCTGAGGPLCDDFGIEGFPTLKWGDPSDLQIQWWTFI